MNELEKMREALSKISKLAAAAASQPGTHGEDDGDAHTGGDQGVCTPKALPRSLLERAARTATDINPMNRPLVGPVAEVAATGDVADPLRIAVLTSKYWGPSNRRLTVSFMEQTQSTLRTRILSHMNSWNCGIQFVQTGGVGQVRISRQEDGYWSYLGTDILHIARTRPTMSLQGFTMNTPESEFKRVVRHETGHTLGFPHEHMRRELVARIDPDKAYEYFRRTQGWDRRTVDQQVLTALDERSIYGTPADQTSVMCYQLPGSITRDGQPILGGTNINGTDQTFAVRIYPPAGAGAALRAESPEGEYQEQHGMEEGFVYEPASLD